MLLHPNLVNVTLWKSTFSLLSQNPGEQMCIFANSSHIVSTTFPNARDRVVQHVIIQKEATIAIKWHN